LWTPILAVVEVKLLKIDWWIFGMLGDLKVRAVSKYDLAIVADIHDDRGGDVEFIGVLVVVT